MEAEMETEETEETEATEIEAKNIENYLEQLTPIEKLILETAYKMLGSSFDISKSIGFLEWKK